MLKLQARRVHTHIQFKLIIFMALRDLWAKRFRSSLTVTGVTIGIGSIFFLLSFGLGLQSLVEGQIIGNKAINTIDITTPDSDVLPINQPAYRVINDLDHVKDTLRMYSYAGAVKNQDATADTVIYGVDPAYIDFSNVTTKAGKILEIDATNQIVIDDSLLQAIGLDDDEKALGKSISLNIDIDGKNHSQNFTIVGVTAATSGSEVFISHQVFQTLGVKNYTQLKAQVDDRTNIPAVRKIIESLGYQTESPVDTLEQINEVFKFFNIILAGFGSIGLIISVLGMLNTLTVSLLEKTQEIALMRALGARARDMRLLFITEGVMLSLIGGILGMILSTLLGLIINAILNQLAALRGVTDSFSIFAVPPLLILGVLVFTCVMGYVVALIPARRAGRINTIEALRHE